MSGKDYVLEAVYYVIAVYCLHLGRVAKWTNLYEPRGGMVSSVQRSVQRLGT
jgi:hypothetical protein